MDEVTCGGDKKNTFISVGSSVWCLGAAGIKSEIIVVWRLCSQEEEFREEASEMANETETSRESQDQGISCLPPSILTITAKARAGWDYDNDRHSAHIDDEDGTMVLIIALRLFQCSGVLVYCS